MSTDTGCSVYCYSRYMLQLLILKHIHRSHHTKVIVNRMKYIAVWYISVTLMTITMVYLFWEGRNVPAWKKSKKNL